MAIEHVAFAARVKRHPAFAETWVKASQDLLPRRVSREIQEALPDRAYSA